MISAHYWPLALTAILGYLVNSARCERYCLVTRPGICVRGCIFSLASVIRPAFGAWLTAETVCNYINLRIYRRWYWRNSRRKRRRGYNLAYNVAVVPPAKLNPIVLACYFRHSPKIGTIPKLRVNFYKLLSVVGYQFSRAVGPDGSGEDNFVPLVFGEKWNSIIHDPALCVVGLLRSVGNRWFAADGESAWISALVQRL